MTGLCEVPTCSALDRRAGADIQWCSPRPPQRPRFFQLRESWIDQRRTETLFATGIAACHQAIHHLDSLTSPGGNGASRLRNRCHRGGRQSPGRAQDFPSPQASGQRRPCRRVWPCAVRGTRYPRSAATSASTSLAELYRWNETRTAPSRMAAAI